MSKLSKRELILLIALTIVIVWYVAIRLLITPWLASITETKAEIEMLQEQKTQMQAVLAGSGTLDEDLVAEQAIKENENFFYKGADDVMVDRQLQQMAERRGLNMTAANISDAVTADVNEYYGDFSVLIYPIRESLVVFDAGAAEKLQQQLALQAPVAEAGEESSLPVTTLPLITNSVTLEGNLSNMVDMINDIANLGQSLYVSDFSLTVSEAGFSDTGSVTVSFFYFEE